MPKHRWLTLAAVVIGVALIVVAVVYWVEPARSLPGFFRVTSPARPPPRQARDRRVRRRPGVSRVRLVPVRAEDAGEVISYWQAIVLGLLQGFSELFPISSLGHSVIVANLLGWDIKQNDDFFLVFLVGTHFATALVLLGFFWADWVGIVKGIGRSLRDRHRADDTDAKLGWLLVVATIPAGILGLLLEHKLRSVFTSAESASFFLMLNGLLLYGAELLRRRAPAVEEQGDPDARISERVGWKETAGIGSAQALALIPGFSRSGATMGGGLLVGLSNEDAARFAFLLATPIIAAAAILKLPDLLGSTGDGVRGQTLVGALCAAVTAYLSVRFLMRFFHTNRLTPFAIYCFCAGLAMTIYFAI